MRDEIINGFYCEGMGNYGGALVMILVLELSVSF